VERSLPDIKSGESLLLHHVQVPNVQVQGLRCSQSHLIILNYTYVWKCDMYNAVEQQLV